METETHWEWSKGKVHALQRLIVWYEGLPPETEVRSTGLHDPIPVANILVWLGRMECEANYNEVERGILNDLLRIRKEWIHGN